MQFDYVPQNKEHKCSTQTYLLEVFRCNLPERVAGFHSIKSIILSMSDFNDVNLGYTTRLLSFKRLFKVLCMKIECVRVTEIVLAVCLH